MFVVSLILTVSISGGHQANALFGGECRDPKKSYQGALISYQSALKKYEIARSNYLAKMRKIEEDCFKDTDTAIRKNAALWKYYKPNKSVFCQLLGTNISTPIQAENPQIQKRRAMEIVVNYKKCFSTNEYLDAKQWLREN